MRSKVADAVNFIIEMDKHGGSRLVDARYKDCHFVERSENTFEHNKKRDRKDYNLENNENFDSRVVISLFFSSIFYRLGFQIEIVRFSRYYLSQ